VQLVPDGAVPDVRKYITAAALVDLCLDRRSYFAVRTQSRRSVQVYDVVQTAPGVMAQEVDLPDLLTHYILNEMAGAERRGRNWIDLVTKDVRDGPSPPAKVISRKGSPLVPALCFACVDLPPLGGGNGHAG